MGAMVPMVVVDAALLPLNAFSSIGGRGLG